jgi:hypothetical protein
MGKMSGYANHTAIAVLLLAFWIVGNATGSDDALSVIERVGVKATVVQGKPVDCMRCHGMETLGYRDTITGGFIDLHVPAADFLDSNHKALSCIECHTAGFDNYPHPEKAKQQSLYCVDCHENNPALIPKHFAEIEKEFKESVHFQRLPEHFSCFSCHNAHYFKVSIKSSDFSQYPKRELCVSCHTTNDIGVSVESVRNVLEMVKYDNQICLNCHAVPVRLKELKESDIPDIATSHKWLPNVEMHWQKVRCIDCHLSTDDNFLHNILTADKAVKHCEECHSANSLLLTKLYKYTMQENRQKYGFINSVTLNDAYIIGMTRNIILDRLSFLILGGMLLVLAAHGFGRWYFARRRRK